MFYFCFYLLNEKVKYIYRQPLSDVDNNTFAPTSAAQAF